MEKRMKNIAQQIKSFEKTNWADDSLILFLSMLGFTVR